MKCLTALILGAALSGGLFLCRVSAAGSAEATVTTMVSFNGTNGAYPRGALILGRDGSLYGTTWAGGADYSGANQFGRAGGGGTVFRISTNGEFATLVSFGIGPTRGGASVAALAQGKDGNFYGTGMYGGEYGHGTVFKVTPHGDATLLASFAGPNGASPQGALVEGRDGNFYGTTRFGGSCTNENYTSETGYGTVFRITTGGALTTLASFNLTNGAFPGCRLLEAPDGCFYGTTLEGGKFRSDVSGSRRGEEHRGKKRSAPYPYMGFGTIFKISTNGVLTTVISFDGTNGSIPMNAGLVMGPDGGLYGMTSRGGAAFEPDTSEVPDEILGNEGYGTVFILTPKGAFVTLASCGDKTGVHPSGSLVLREDGNFYGLNMLLLIRVTPKGVITPLAAVEGAWPFSGLVRGGDGNLYGTSDEGGTNKMGSVFRVGFTRRK